MFFIFGISNKEKKFEFSQTRVCKTCGSFGRLEAFMTYSFFSLFFIPIIKWNKKYYVRSTCCGSLYTIDAEIGKAIRRGEDIKIEDKDLKPINIDNRNVRYCENCNYKVENEFEYCPKCGEKL